MVLIQFLLKKNEFEIYSPISKIQKILLIINEKDSGNPSYFDVNMYTDKVVIMPFKIPVQYKIIRKNNEDNLLMKYFPYDLSDPFYNNNGYLLLEKISGDFTLHINNSNFKHYIYENIHFFEHETNKEILSLKISAQKDSIYSIKYYEYTKSINQHLFYIGGNYLLKIQNDELGISIHGMAGVKHYVNVYEEVIVNFLPIDCTVDILYGDINTYQFPELKDTIIYQNIPLKLLPFYKLKVKTEKEKNSCMIYASSYFLNESLIVDEKSFILAENVPKIVIFNNYVNKTKYSYYTLVKNEDIKINFVLLNKGEYEIIFLIN